MNRNSVTLIGALLDDPTVTDGATHFSIETGERSRDVHLIVAHGRIGQVAAKYLKCGSRVFIEGRLSSHGEQATAEVEAAQLVMLGAKHGGHARP